jgi:hypothetical protein
MPNRIRRTLVFLSVSLVLGSHLGAQQPIRRPPPGTQLRTSDESILAPNRVTSLEDLSRRTPVIVEADVQAIFPGVMLGDPRSIYILTDVQFRVVRVLKGDNNLQGRQIVVSQRGGSVEGVTEVFGDNTLMKPGERFVLFLSPDSAPPSEGLPARENLPRYQAASMGTIMIKEGRVQVGKGQLEIARDYQSMSSEQFMAEVRAYASTNSPQEETSKNK